jgi:hypothetical protein
LRAGGELVIAANQESYRKGDSMAKQIASTQVRIGDWVYDPTTLTVQYGESGNLYVDLEKCSTSAQMLDWVFQFASKRWATNQAIGDLVLLLNQLLHPQSNLCSGGVESGRLPTGPKLRKLIRDKITERRIVKNWKKTLKTRRGSQLVIVKPSDWQELNKRIEAKTRRGPKHPIKK